MPETHEVLPELVASEVILRGRVFDVSRDTLRFADGQEMTREIIHHIGAVAMLALDDDGCIWFVEQYRHATGGRLLEIPAGTLEPGEEPIATAERELQEEIGMRPADLEQIGGFYVAPGYASEYIHLFRCTGLTPSRLPGDEDEDITTVRLTLNEAMGAVAAGRIVDAKTIIALYRHQESSK